jgi:hypothetical protein
LYQHIKIHSAEYIGDGNDLQNLQRHCYTPEDVKKLVAYILDWWDEHQYDTTGEYGEYNVYDNEPSFVVKAKLMRDKGV